MFSFIEPLWVAWVVALLAAFASTVASVHVILHKRDERAALGWVGVIWLAPGFGAGLYVLFGINRIRRRARRLRAPQRDQLTSGLRTASVEAAVAEEHGLAPLARALDRVARYPRVSGNRIAPLINGDEAYPEMLDAISRAQRSIALMTYIFDNDSAGSRFVDALGAAAERGVDVRVIIDDAGMRYSRPTVQRGLRKRGVQVARFMKAVFSRVPYMNLRTHRKLLVVDGSVAFTGGMNIREGHLVGESPAHPVRDMHFRLEGPIVPQLLEVFGEDWRFCAGAALEGDAWRATAEPRGESVARTIPDGPDEDHDRLRWAYLSGLAAARRSVRIVTPYFLPDQSMTEALAVASYRGVRVDVVIPWRCNLFFVQWAVWGQLLPIIESCRVWLSPLPFDHTKLMIVDDEWVLIGSGNWDPRSYRLNFELGVEIYDAGLAGRLADEVDRRIASSKRATRRGWHRRRFPVRLRDSIARLFAPYL